MTRPGVEQISLRDLIGDPSLLDRCALSSRFQVANEELWFHARAVAILVNHSADHLGVNSSIRQTLVDAAWFHDLGKLTISPEILSKPGPLDESEWSIVRQHAVIGAAYLAEFDCLEAAPHVVRHHHECFDGRGYPDGLIGFEIPFGARLVAVADAFHAMTSERPYSPAKSRESACDELQRCSGTQFDPEIVEMFVHLQRGNARHS